MATNILYPPILNSTISADTVEGTNSQLIIPFALHSTASFNTNEYGSYIEATEGSGICHIQIKIVRQSDGACAFSKSLTADGNAYYNSEYVGSDGIMYIPVTGHVFSYTTDQYQLEGALTSNSVNWEYGMIYKIQMRFGLNRCFRDTNSTSSAEDFITWKRTNVNEDAFSEWSDVMLFKQLRPGEISILNLTSRTKEQTIGIYTESSTMPTFTGNYSDKHNVNDYSEEDEESYQFTLYSGSTPQESAIIEQTGWIAHDSYNSSSDTCIFSHILSSGNTYTVRYEVKTINNHYYTTDSDDNTSYDDYTFKVSSAELTQLVWLFKTQADAENGCVNVLLNSTKMSGDTTEGTSGSFTNILSGNYIILRSSEYSNFEVWEELKYLVYADEQIGDENNDEIILKDYTIESGIKYLYAFTKENANGYRTSPEFSVDEDSSNVFVQTTYSDDGTSIANNRYPALINLEYAYLYADGVQLKLMYDVSLSSFKHTTLVSKQDTIGSKYPTIMRNGIAYYAEFPLSGLISFHMDTDNETFMQEYLTELKFSVDYPNKTFKKAGYYYKGEYIIPAAKYDANEDVDDTTRESSPMGNWNYKDTNKYTTDLTDNMIFIERKFREKVEEFLNDGGYKLFRTATEGNFIITLTNVSLTPKTELGRMIYSFSATAYEVEEFSLEKLTEFGVYTVGTYTAISTLENRQIFGQLSGLYTGYQTKDFYIDNEDLSEEEAAHNAKFVAENSQLTIAQCLTTTEDEDYSDTEDVENLYSQISTDISALKISDDGGIYYSLENLLAFQIIDYPQLTFDSQIDYLNSQICSEEIIANDTSQSSAIIAEAQAKVEALKDQRDEYYKIIKYTTKEPDPRMIHIKLSTDSKNYANAQELILQKNRMYYLDELGVTGNIRGIWLKYTGGIIINYIAEVSVNENADAEASDLEETSLWGQLAGLFCNTNTTISEDILKAYDYDWNNHNRETSTGSYINVVYNRPMDQRLRDEVTKEAYASFGESYGNFDHINYNVYANVEDVIELIEQDARRQLFNIYGLGKYKDKNGNAYTDFPEYDAELKVYKIPISTTKSNGQTSTRYLNVQFNILDMIDIEAHQGTKIILGNHTRYYLENEAGKVDLANGILRTVVVGPSERIVFNPNPGGEDSGAIRYLNFFNKYDARKSSPFDKNQSVFAIINYTCKTKQWYASLNEEINEGTEIDTLEASAS